MDRMELKKGSWISVQGIYLESIEKTEKEREKERERDRQRERYMKSESESERVEYTIS